MGSTTATSGRRRRDQGHHEPPVISGRVPPHDLDAEAAVLSACLLDKHALDRVMGALEPDHFYSDANRLIFEACQKLVIDGTPIDVVTVADWLRARETIQRAGGTAYIGQITDATPAPGNVLAHAEIVREKWRLRRAIAVCQKFSAEGYGDVGDPQTFLDGLEQEVYDLNHQERPTELEHVKDVFVEAFTDISAAAEKGGVMGIPTRYVDLDKKTAGLHRGDLMIVAARPGMGKTSFVLNLAINVASPETIEIQGDDPYDRPEEVQRPGLATAIFSLEMPKKQVAYRLSCVQARVDLGKIRQGFLTQEDWAALTTASKFLTSLPIYIDDTPSLGILELRAKIRRLQVDHERLHGPGSRIGLVVIDYLQLMTCKADSREQEISKLSRSLKVLAKELDVPVVALSQLNRGVETRPGKDKRPLISDLRESGAIEQDADVIVFIYRDEYYNRETTEDRGIAELIIAKQRNGPTGTVRTRFISHCTKFENLAPGEYEEYAEL